MELFFASKVLFKLSSSCWSFSLDRNNSIIHLHGFEFFRTDTFFGLVVSECWEYLWECGVKKELRMDIMLRILMRISCKKKKKKKQNDYDTKLRIQLGCPFFFPFLFACFSFLLKMKNPETLSNEQLDSARDQIKFPKKSTFCNRYLVFQSIVQK